MLRKSLMTCVVAVLAVLFTIVAAPQLPYPGHSTAAASDAVAKERKTVTVYADNETEAVARAEKDNRGWKATSAKKVNKDPKSRSWQVTLTKG